MDHHCYLYHGWFCIECTCNVYMQLRLPSQLHDSYSAVVDGLEKLKLEPHDQVRVLRQDILLDTPILPLTKHDLIITNILSLYIIMILLP